MLWTFEVCEMYRHYKSLASSFVNSMRKVAPFLKSSHKYAYMDMPISSPTPRLPVDNGLRYHTMPMKCMTLVLEIRQKTQGGLFTPNTRGMSMTSSLQTHTKLKAELTISTAQHCPYIAIIKSR